LGKRAFVVEDEENVREIIRCALESGGLEVSGFEDASAMFAALRDGLPDILLLDIMLPGMDGFETLRRLKKNPKTARLPVILLTARGAETDKVAGLDLGAEDYITKPFGVLELMARVRTVLRRRQDTGTGEAVYKFKDLQLDVARHEVLLNGKPLELTLKEFELLRVLMQHPGRVLTRDFLLDTVWGYSYAGETRTLDMHIRGLRRKLGDSADDGHISTVRGVGYRFNAK
jgi:two-component system alkaline phosphatase synthesis response regulator PhoP